MYCNKCIRVKCITCTICNNGIHKKCFPGNHEPDSADIDNWYCSSCLGHALPFNHFLDDDEFVHEIMQFNQDHQISYLKLQSLNINPFNINDLTDNNNDNNDLDPTNSNPNNHIDKCNYYLSDQFNDKCSSTNHGLSIIHINSRSLTKNFDSISDYIYTLSHKFSILAFSESWFSDNNSAPPLTHINGYSMVQSDRLNRRGGGVVLYIDNSLNFKLRTDINMPTNSDYESLFIEINNKPQNTIIGVVYRPPDRSTYPFLDNFSHCLDSISKENKQCFICGDFNLDLMKYTMHTGINDFINLLYSASFYPLIDKPTRVTTKSATLIDNIFTNCLDLRITPGILFTDISDHFPIFQIINSPNSLNDRTKAPKFYTKRKINKSTLASLGIKLCNTNWDEVYTNSSADGSFNHFMGKFSSTYNECLPVTKSKIKSNKHQKPWITNGIIKSIKVRNKLYKKFIVSPTTINKSNYIKHRNKITHLIRMSRKKHYNDKFTNYKNNIKQTWRTINDILGKNN